MNLTFALKVFLYLMFYLNVLYMGSTLLAALAFRVQIKEVEIFKGKLKRTYRFAGITFNRRTLPHNSSITFALKEEFQDGRLARKPGQVALNEAPCYAQAAIALAGCVALSLFALAVLGIQEFIQHVGAGLRQLFDGGLSPCVAGQAYLAKFFAVYGASTISAFALLATKQVAFNFIPVYGTPIHSIFNWPIISRYPGSVAEKISRNLGILFILVAIVPLGGWAVAILVYPISALKAAICQ